MCEVPLSATQANWFMEETRLEQNTKFYMEEKGTVRRLTIHNVTTNDDGVYICEMKEGSRTVAELTVLGMSQNFLPLVLDVIKVVKCNWCCMKVFSYVSRLSLCNLYLFWYPRQYYQEAPPADCGSCQRHCYLLCRAGASLPRCPLDPQRGEAEGRLQNLHCVRAKTVHTHHQRLPGWRLRRSGLRGRRLQDVHSIHCHW